MPAQPMITTSAPSCSLQLPPDGDHAVEGLLARRGFCDRHLQGALAGEAVAQAHLAQIADMPGDRALSNRDDPEAVGPRQGGEHRAFGDAEDRPRRPFAA